MKGYRYHLDTKKPRQKITCPGCGHKKVFVRYVDAQTGKYLPEEYGKCDRDNNCTYWHNPYDDGYSKRVWEQEKAEGKIYKPKFVSKPYQPPSFISFDVFKKSLGRYDANNLVIYLNNKFGVSITKGLVERYYIGTSKHQFFKPQIHPDYISPQGASIFWQRDIKGRITAGKVILYNADTGKRMKEPFNHVDWAHNLLKLPEPRPYQCLFGEHLLKVELYKPVAIVESEKTAIIASVYLPQFVWLATGSLVMLTSERCQVLKGREVILFPDLNGFEKWKVKSEELSDITKFVVSDFLQLRATELEKMQGLDIADYLIEFDMTALLG